MAVCLRQNRGFVAISKEKVYIPQNPICRFWIKDESFYMSHYEARSQELKHTKKQLAHKAKYSTRSEMSVREQRTRLQELKAEFLTNPKLDSYVKKLFDIALDDDHQGQMGAIKLIADRVLPNQAFAHSAKGNNSVNINISGLQVDIQKDVTPADDLDDLVDEQ